jgi:hypothetical protein
MRTVADVSPAGQTYLNSVRASAANGPSASTPSSGSSSSSPGGSNGSDSGSGGSGGGNAGGSSTGGSGGKKMSPERKLQIVFVCVLMLSAILVAISMSVYSFRSATPQGEKHIEVLETYRDKKEVREHEEKMAKLRIQAARRGLIIPASPPVTSVTVSNCINATGAGIRRVQAIELSYGVCVAFTATPTQNAFWVSFKGPPQEVVGSNTLFATFHDATEAEQTERFGICMAKTNDREYCDAEKKKEKEGKVGIRDDLGCGTSDSPDKCLGYLKEKAGLGPRPVMVRTQATIQINM